MAGNTARAQERPGDIEVQRGGDGERPPVRKVSLVTAAAFFFVELGDYSPCASGGEGLGEDAADALPGAGDDGDTFIERMKNDILQVDANFCHSC